MATSSTVELVSVSEAVSRCTGEIDACVDPAVNHALARAVLDARLAGAADAQIADAISLAAAGYIPCFKANRVDTKILLANRSALIAGDDRAKTAARLGWEIGRTVLTFSSEDAAAIIRSGLAPSAAVNVALLTDDDDVEAAVRVATLALDIEVSVGFAHTAAESCYRRDHRPIALCLAGVSERLVLVIRHSRTRRGAIARRPCMPWRPGPRVLFPRRSLKPSAPILPSLTSASIVWHLERYAHSAAALPHSATSIRAFDLLAEARQQAGANGLRNAQILTGGADDETAMRLGALSLGVAPWRGCRRIAETADGDVFAALDQFALQGFSKSESTSTKRAFMCLVMGCWKARPASITILQRAGFTAHEIGAAEAALTTAGTFKAAFAPVVLGEGFVRDVLGADEELCPIPRSTAFDWQGFQRRKLRLPKPLPLGPGLWRTPRSLNLPAALCSPRTTRSR